MELTTTAGVRGAGSAKQVIRLQAKKNALPEHINHGCGGFRTADKTTNL